MTSDLTIYAKWLFDDEWIEDLGLQSLIGETINSDVVLPTSYGSYTLEYSSSDENLFSNSGIYTRPYQKSTVAITVRLLNGSIEVDSTEFNPIVEGYKDLTGPIASNYVYTNYSQLTEQFFDTMDIINCAFALIDVDGGYTGLNGEGSSISYTNNKYLGYMRDYVLPEAHERGDWVVVSIGGGGTAYDLAFEAIAQDETKLNNLVTNTVNLINTYGFDGVDIDWEVPDDGSSFIKVAKAIYEGVKANNPNHLVTAAIGGGKWQPPKYGLSESKNYLDYINLMTYNMSTSAGYHHSALYGSSVFFDTTNKVGKTLGSCSIDESITFYNTNYGIPASQLIIGAAFYAIKQVRTDTSSDWTYKGTVSYTSIKNDYLTSSDYVYGYDTNCQAPYLLSNDGLTFISYDDPTSIKAKCQYVIDKGVAGIMYWQNGQDTTGDLVNAIYESFK